MNIRDCECGGKRLIQSTKLLKVTGDKKIRFRCNQCRKLFSAYKTAEGLSVGARANGRPLNPL